MNEIKAIIEIVRADGAGGVEIQSPIAVTRSGMGNVERPEFDFEIVGTERIELFDTPAMWGHDGLSCCEEGKVFVVMRAGRGLVLEQPGPGRTFIPAIPP